MRDEDHAIAVREAVKGLHDALRDAASDGIVVRLSIIDGHGSQRNRERSTKFETVHIKEVVRPL